MSSEDDEKLTLTERLRLSGPHKFVPDASPTLYFCIYCHTHIHVLVHEFRICQSRRCIEQAIADRDEYIFQTQLSIPIAHTELLKIRAELSAKICELEENALNSMELAQYKAQLSSLNVNLAFHVKNDRIDQIVSLQDQIRELSKRVNRPSFSEEFRRKLWERDRRVCYLCEKIIVSCDGASMHVDHVRPRSQGGSDDSHNLRIAHPVCNLQKGDRELSERRVQALLNKLRKTEEEKARERLF